MSELNSPLSQQPYEVLINGRLYDCRNFKHPGGSILKFFFGSGDATDLFMENHARFPAANKRLKLLPNRISPERNNMDEKETARLNKLSLDFMKLRTECMNEGLYNASYFHILYRLSELIILHFIGLWILINTSYWIPACFILGIAEGRCGWVEHECGHYGFFCIPWLDQKFQEICYGFGDGMSAAWWRIQHNKHHASPQKLQHDVDLDTLPLVAFNKAVAKKAKNKNILVRKWLSMQMYLFIPITCSLVAIFWQLYLHPRHMIRTRRYTEIISIICRIIFIVYICQTMQLTLFQSIAGYLFYQFFGAAYIFVNFSLSHSHLDVLSANKHVHFIEYSSIYTINISSNWLTNWWMGYLNFQIEHHLFPSMPQFKLVKVQKRVRDMFEANGLKYDSMPYFEALIMSLKNLNHVASVFDDSSISKTKDN